MTGSNQHIEQDMADLRGWIARMRERDEWPETDLALMDAIERLIEQLKAEEARAEAFYQDYDQAQDRLVRTQEQLKSAQDALRETLALRENQGQIGLPTAWEIAERGLGSNPARES